MAGRAIWRAAAGDPRSRLGWAAQDWDHWAVVALKKLLLALLLCGGYALWRADFVVGFILLPTVGSCVGKRGRLSRKVRGPRLTLPPPTTPFPGDFEIWDGGSLLGRDRGVATFVDGWLLVEGNRTEFSLRSSDVASLKKGDERWDLVLGDGLAVRFWPDDRLEDDGVREDDLRARFVRSLAAWRAESAPGGDGSVLPPNSPHASGWARAWVGTVVALLGLAATLFLMSSYGVVWGIASIVLMPGPSPFGAIYDLGRLRRPPLPSRRARALPYMECGDSSPL